MEYLCHHQLIIVCTKHCRYSLIMLLIKHQISQNTGISSASSKELLNFLLHLLLLLSVSFKLPLMKDIWWHSWRSSSELRLQDRCRRCQTILWGRAGHRRAPRRDAPSPIPSSLGDPEPPLPSTWIFLTARQLHQPGHILRQGVRWITSYWTFLQKKFRTVSKSSHINAIHKSNMIEGVEHSCRVALWRYLSRVSTYFFR